MEFINRPGTVPVSLALEGGGALGAFTWGVLERLLEEQWLQVVRVSGASAGAMNGAMLVQGLAQGGAAGASALLETFWHRVSIAAGSVPGLSSGWMQMLSGTVGPMLDAVKAGSGLGMLRINPLRGILAELLHPPRFGEAGLPELLVAATRVRTGEARVFRGAEVTLDALLASACLPMLFPAVEIDDEAYWDGGYSSNPPVRALIEAGEPADVLIVRTTPGEWAGAPLGSAALRERINEITFGTPLRGELRSVAIAQRSLGGVDGLPDSLARLRAARIHMIRPSAEDAAAADPLHPSWPMLADQRARGRAAAGRWLEAHGTALGHESTVALDGYLDRAFDGALPRVAGHGGVEHAT